jgi:hypothetical protein
MESNFYIENNQGLPLQLCTQYSDDKGSNGYN